jgi:hypothetical protein
MTLENKLENTLELALLDNGWAIVNTNAHACQSSLAATTTCQPNALAPTFDQTRLPAVIALSC